MHVGEAPALTAIEHAEKFHAFATYLQLMCYLERRGSAKGIAQEIIGTLRLNFAHLGEVISCLVLHAKQPGLARQQGLSLDAVDGVFRSDQHSKLIEANDVSSSAMNDEQRSGCAVRLHWH